MPAIPAFKEVTGESGPHENLPGFTTIPQPDGRDASTPSGSLLVLGLGNDILCDDAVGLLVAREIRSRLHDQPGVDVSETCEMGLSLLDHIVGYLHLLIIDSIQTGKVPPGHVHEMEGQNLRVLPVTSPHLVGVGEMILLGRQLGLTVPESVRIFAIEVQDPFTVSTQLTPALRSALPEIVDRISQSLTR